MSKIFNFILLVCAAAFCWYFYYAINLEGNNIRQGTKFPPNNISKPLEKSATSTDIGIVADDTTELTAATTPGDFTGVYESRPNPDCVSGECPGAWLSVEHSGREVIFGIDASRGAPGYNMGTVYPVKVTLSGDRAVYRDSQYGDCEFTVDFSKDRAIITPLNDASDCWSACGFGYGVCVGGEYKKIGGEIPDFGTFGPTGVGKPVKDMTQNNE